MISSKLLQAALIAFAIGWSGAAVAQTAAQPADAAEIGNVTSVQGTASVSRNGAARGLAAQDVIFKGDVLTTGTNSTLAITFDDETTFNLSANASITVDEFVYQEGGSGNSALFKIARGTIAFAANQVAKSGDMKIETPSTVLGIRGTSGVIEVPAGATPGTTGEVAVKLYQDEDGRVGRIELFGAGGARLGALTRAATGFSLRGGGGRFAAVPLTISPQQIARDRGFMQRTFAARNIGRQFINQRRILRGPGLRRGLQQRPGLQRPGQLRRGPGLQNQPGVLPRNQNLQRNLQRTPNTRGGRQPGRRRPNEILPR